MKGQSHDFERKQQIGKDDGRIHAQGLSGRDRHLGRYFRPLAYLDQRILLADGAVFRHVTARLAHEPDRRPIHRKSTASLDEAGFGSRH